MIPVHRSSFFQSLIDIPQLFPIAHDSIEPDLSRLPLADHLLVRLLKLAHLSEEAGEGIEMCW
jgi:hypothetical protein